MMRYTVHFSGQVQGVGFRYTTQHIARRYAVSGFVQNLPDASVRVVAEGEPDQVEAFVQDVAQSMHTCVREQTTQTSAATGEFTDGFQVRF